MQASRLQLYDDHEKDLADLSSMDGIP